MSNCMRFNDKNGLPVHINCRSASQPTEDHECREAVWSQGRACWKCEIDCYRKGWLKKDVDLDNAIRVAGNVDRAKESRTDALTARDGQTKEEK